MSKVNPKIKHIQDKISVQKLHPKAEFPYKERVSDVGYNVTLIGRTENRAEDTINDVNEFNTGLNITPPKGYFLEVMVNSSLHKHGYTILGGSIIINPEDTGEVIVPLFKFKDGDDLVLPFKGVQLILRQAVYAHISNVSVSSQDNMQFLQTNYMMPSQPRGQDSRRMGYAPNMQTYQQQKGTKTGNHMF